MEGQEGTKASSVERINLDSGNLAYAIYTEWILRIESGRVDAPAIVYYW